MAYQSNLLRHSVVLLLLMANSLNAQSWVKDSTTLFPDQFGNPGSAINLKFKCPGPFGKCWMYGTYWDQDSIRRIAAYRSGGTWISLPISGHKDIVCLDIAQVGDTLLLGGGFGDIELDSGNIFIPHSNLLKYFEDSLWSDDRITGPYDIEVLGDTVLIWGFYSDSVNTIDPHVVSYDGGNTFEYPYSTIHPYLSYPSFGPTKDLEILINGSIFSVLNSSPRVNPYAGSVIWDGLQWIALGSGLFGWSSQSRVIHEHLGKLYMGGTFRQLLFPSDPANGLAQWNGINWEDVGGGVSTDVYNIFTYDSLLCVEMYGSDPSTHKFGDLSVSFMAGWNGTQWCGTPTSFSHTPNSFGVVNDTLYVSFLSQASINGQNMGYLAYYSDDYFHGAMAKCSTPGLSISNFDHERRIEVYPNPSSNHINILIDSTPERVSIYTTSGKLVLTSTGVKIIDITALQIGVYIIEIELAGFTHREKLFVR